MPILGKLGPSFRKSVGVMLLLFSIYYIGTHFTIDWLNVFERSATSSILWMLASLFFATLSVAMSAVIFGAILEPASLCWTHFRIARYFARSQLARYLPGKVAGVIYLQIQLYSEYSAKKVISASVFHLGITYLWALFVGVLTLVLFFDLMEERFLIYGTLLGGCLVLIVYVLRKYAVRYFIQVIRSGGLDFEREKVNLYGIAFGIVFQWTPLVMSLFIYLMDWDKSLLYISLYLVSSVGSSLVSITPGAIVVREGMFVYLTALMGAPVQEATDVALYLRVLLTASELCLFSILEAISIGKSLYGFSNEG